MENLSGQTAMISGGLGDIGRAIALELARRGADIAVGDVLEEARAEDLLAEIRKLGRKARYDRVDVSQVEEVRGWRERAHRDLGLPTLIVPNAAVVALKGIRDVTVDEWDRQMRVNLDGAFYMAQAGAEALLEAGSGGRIVFIGSWVAHAPQPHIAAYCVTKAGLRMLCKVMALELAPHGILVNEVAPGNVDAGLSARIFEQNPAWRERNLKRVPILTMSQAEEVAYHVAYLCDPANRQMTGSVVLMDGGLSLLSGPNPDQNEG